MTTAVRLILLSDALLRGPNPQIIAIGVLVPMSGVMGVAGPSIINCAILAAENLSALDDSEIDLVLIDAGKSPAEVAREVDLLVSANLVDGLVGTHPSNVRAAVQDVLGGRVPYIFTPPHEGAASSTGSIYLGSNPAEQLSQPITWLSKHRKISRWALIGNDYAWPRQVHRAARQTLAQLGQNVVLDRLVPVGQVDVEELAHAAKRAGAEGILVSLIGRDGIDFHRTLTEIGAANHFVRLCSALDENCLLAAGGDETGNLYSALPSFIKQTDERHLQLMENYTSRFGVQSPLPGTYAEGCYDGVHLMGSMLTAGLRMAAQPLFQSKTTNVAIALGIDLEPIGSLGRV